MVWWKMFKILDKWKQAKLQDQIQINAVDLNNVKTWNYLKFEKQE
jgi:hypothetical protein